MLELESLLKDLLDRLDVQHNTINALARKIRDLEK